MKTLLIAALLLGFTGCSIALLPGADRVTITKNPDDVVNCKIIGYGSIAMRGPNAQNANNYSKNNILIRGGDTILTTHTDMFVDYGVVYNCRGNDIREPFPVQIK